MYIYPNHVCREGEVEEELELKGSVNKVFVSFKLTERQHKDKENKCDSISESLLKK